MAADPTDIRVPSECREMIRAGALVAVNHSGGKDSQAMTILLSSIFAQRARATASMLSLQLAMAAS